MTENLHSESEHESTTGSNRLLGVWRLIRAEGGMDSKDGVTMTFAPNGQLTYVLHDGKKKQIINLTYRIEGDTLITDQPSKPKVEITKFWLDPNQILILMYGDITAWFIRESDAVQH